MKALIALIATLIAGAALQARDPDLIITKISVSDTTLKRGESVTVFFTVKNQGNKAAGSMKHGIMFSADSTISRNGDTLLEKEPQSFLFSGQSFAQTRTVKIPSNATRGATYYLGVWADYDYDEDENGANSNNGSKGVRITITDERADFTPLDLTVNNTTKDTDVHAGQSIDVKWTAKNQGATTLKGTEQAVVFSTDSNIDRSDTVLEFEGLGLLTSGQTSPEIRKVKIPDSAKLGDTYYIGVYMDWDREVSERSESNNDSNAVPVTIAVEGFPDLIAEDLQVSTTAGKAEAVSARPGDSLNLSWTARNRGTKGTSIIDFTSQAVLWSEDSSVSLNNDTTLENEPLGPLARGDDSPELRTVKVPDDAIVFKNYYIAIYSDSKDEENESNENNNLSNSIRVYVIPPDGLGEITSTDVTDRNRLPYLDSNDGRLTQLIGTDDRYMMNPSCTFAPNDIAIFHANVEHDDKTFGDTTKTRITAYYNSTKSESGRAYANHQVRLVDSKGDKDFHVTWRIPEETGDYYVQLVSEIGVPDGDGGDQWIETDSTWVHDGDPIIVTDDVPIILIHGWSDEGGTTFANLEMLLEVELERPVRFFNYSTGVFASQPRVDVSHDGKPDLADQLEAFLKRPEPGANEIRRTDIVVHSMGGLVARNYALQESKIRRLITLGTPNYGGNNANTAGLILNNQAEDLEYGSAVAWKIHRGWESRFEGMPDTLTIVGTNNALLGKYNNSDILVRCSSASLENLGYPVYYVPRGHSNFYSPFGQKGIPNIEDTSDESWKPIKKFLSGDSAPFDNLPGNLGGADDVGHADHDHYLESGIVLIVSLNGSPTNIIDTKNSEVGWNKNNVNDAFDKGTNDTGIYYIVGRKAAESERSNQKYTEYEISIDPGTITAENQTFDLYAGQTKIIIAGNAGAPSSTADTDGDLLPDLMELEAIDKYTDDDFLSFEDFGPTSDFDHDGLAEHFELAAGTDPLTHDSDGILSIRQEDGYLIIRFVQDTGNQSFSLNAQASEDLSSWNEQGVTVSTIEETESHLVREWRVPANEAAKFLRLRLNKRANAPR